MLLAGYCGARNRTRPPLATGGRYVNFTAAEDLGAAAASRPVYDARAGERLAALKRRYDPENVFRLNHNIAP